MGAPEAAMRISGCSLGALGPSWGASKIIEKPLVFVVFSSMGGIWGAPWVILAAFESALEGLPRLRIDNEMYRPFCRQSDRFSMTFGTPVGAARRALGVW